MKFDHHLHTARHSPDSVIDPLDLVESAREIGLDGLVITEHDYQWDDEELAELAAAGRSRSACSRAPRSRPARGISWCTASPRSMRFRRASSWRSCSASSGGHDAAIVAAHPVPLGPAVRRDRRRARPGVRCPGTGQQQRDDRDQGPDRASPAASGRWARPAPAMPTRSGHLGCYFTEFDGRSGRSRDFVARPEVAARTAEASHGRPPQQRAGLLGADVRSTPDCGDDRPSRVARLHPSPRNRRSCRRSSS